jgi:hypothetical protein
MYKGFILVGFECISAFVVMSFDEDTERLMGWFQ